MTRSLVIMGVAGCGKSSLGATVAERLGWPLIEGDDHHSPDSRDKMRRGIALTDGDRAGWLDRLGAALQQHEAVGQAAVLSCSALKQAYRARLRQAVPGLRFVFLDIDRAEALRRVATRSAHFFSATLVDNQFATLERPDHEDGVLCLEANQPLDKLSQAVVDWLGAPGTLTSETELTTGAAS